MSIIVPDDPIENPVSPGPQGPPGADGAPGADSRVVLPQEYVYALWNQGGAHIPERFYNGQLISPNFGYNGYSALPVIGKQEIPPPVKTEQRVDLHGEVITVTFFDVITDPVRGVKRQYPGVLPDALFVADGLGGWAKMIAMWEIPAFVDDSRTTNEFVRAGDVIQGFTFPHDSPGRVGRYFDWDGNEITFTPVPTGLQVPGWPGVVNVHGADGNAYSVPLNEGLGFRFRRVGRRVELSGGLPLNTNADPGTVICTLPPLFRPTKTEHYPVYVMRSGYFLTDDFGGGAVWAFPDVVYDENGNYTGPQNPTQQQLYTSNLNSILKAGMLRIEPSGQIIVDVSEATVDPNPGDGSFHVNYTSAIAGVEGITFSVAPGDELEPLPIWTPPPLDPDPSWDFAALRDSEESFESLMNNYDSFAAIKHHRPKES